MLEPGELLSTMDAKVWADEFMETKARLGEKEFDHAMMLAWFANAIMAGFDEATRRQQATIADLQGQVKEAQECLSLCEHELGAVRIDRAILQQRVAQLEGERDALKRDQFAAHACAKTFEQMSDEASLKRLLATIQADHATLLGLVQDTVQFFESNFENAGRELCGLVNGKDITPTGQRLNELIEQLAASLPAQPAQGPIKKCPVNCPYCNDPDYGHPGHK
jgi:hypothetical protein